MKKYILFAITTVLSAFCAKAEDLVRFEYTSNGSRLFYEILSEEDRTCQTAAARNYELRDNGTTWVNGTEVKVKDLFSTVEGAENVRWDGTLQGPNFNPYNGNLSIPSEVEFNGKTYKVVRIGEYSFANGYVQSVNIPESVTEMGEGAFFRSQVQNITSFGGITELSDYAFYFIRELQGTLTIPEGIEIIGEGCFSMDTNIKSLVLNEGLTDIKAHAFEGNTGITETLYIPASVTSIGSSAFKDCMSMGNLYFNDVENSNLTYIGNYAFENCNLAAQTPDKPIVLPPSLDTIGEGAFQNCKISYLEFSEGLKYIGAHAFDGNDDLKGALKIPKSVITIGDYAFNMCSNTEGIIFDPEGDLKTIGAYAFFHARNYQHWDMRLPAGVESIGPYAFVLINTGGDSRDPEEPCSWSDLYVYREDPPTAYGEGEGGEIEEAFGIWMDEFLTSNSFFQDPLYWCYAWVCLHVPVGTRETYQNSKAWCNFQCIIDDIILEPGDPSDPENNESQKMRSLDSVLGYAFIAPGDQFDLEVDLLPNAEALKTMDVEWDTVTLAQSDNTVTIDEKGHVVAGKIENGEIVPGEFGKYLALARADNENQIFDKGDWRPYKEIVGVVVIYVCPKVILAYELEEAVNAPKEEVRAKAVAASDQPNLATYEHLVVYNSYPQVKIESANGYEIGKIYHDDAEADGNWNYSDVKTDDKVVTKADEDDDDVSNDYTALALNEPVTNNRVVLLTVSYNSNPDDYKDIEGTPTGVQDVQVSAKIRVKVAGNVVTVIGAEDSDVVTVSNLKGQTVSRSTDKTVVLDRGIFVINVADASLKIIVR